MFNSKVRKFAAVAAAMSPVALFAEEGTTSLLTSLQTQLTDVISGIKDMQITVLGAALVIVIGFVTYRLIKSSANKIG